MKRLLILSCSQRKSLDKVLVPALQRYNGPAFLLLRRFIREESDAARNLDVYILSAEFGIISHARLIPYYDRVVTAQRAAELKRIVVPVLADVFRASYKECCIVLSKQYIEALEGWRDVAPPDLGVTIITAAQGVKLARLKSWLYGEQRIIQNRTVKVIKVSGFAALRGVEIRLTPDQIFERLNSRLTNTAKSADDFREWYINIEGRHASIKWAVSVLTGLPVSSFSTGDARRVLCQLGVIPQQVVRPINDNNGI